MSMKLLMLTALAGSAFSVAKGDVVAHYDDAEARRWIDAEFAEEAPKGAKVTVVIMEPEAAPLAPEVETIEAAVEDASEAETTADATTVETTADTSQVETR